MSATRGFDRSFFALVRWCCLVTLLCFLELQSSRLAVMLWIIFSASPFVNALLRQKIPVTEVFYPESKEFLVHEYQFMMGKKASQQTFQQTIQFIQKYSASALSSNF